MANIQRGIWNPNIRLHTECSTSWLTGSSFLSHVFDTGPRFTNGFSVAFQIRWKFRFTLIASLMEWSLCRDLMTSNRITARRIFLWIWIAGKKSLVKRAPGSDYLVCKVNIANANSAWKTTLIFAKQVFRIMVLWDGNRHAIIWNNSIFH